MKIILIFATLIIQFSVPSQTLSKNIAANRCESSFAGLGYKHASGGGDFIVMEFIINSKVHGPHTVLIDDEDWDDVRRFSWGLRKTTVPSKFYVVGFIKGRNEYQPIHRYLLRDENGNYPSLPVDHKNGNPLDNRRNNIRLCTTKQNRHNSAPIRNSFSGLKGVSWISKIGKWEVKLKVDGVLVDRLQFLNKYTAALYYNELAIKHQKDFAWLNKLTEDQIKEGEAAKRLPEWVREPKYHEKKVSEKYVYPSKGKGYFVRIRINNEHFTARGFLTVEEAIIGREKLISELYQKQA